MCSLYDGPLTYAGPIPASAAWREEDNPGRRQFLDVGPLDLELGGHLPAVRVAYETFGELNAEGTNAVLICHALTGDSHVSGPAGPGHLTAGWWDSIVGPGKALDTNEWFVVCPNILGGCQGTTGPSSIAPDGQPWGSRWPRITVRDQVEVERRVTAALDLNRWAAVLGCSLGGMRSLEWAVTEPERVGAVLVGVVGAATTADQISTHRVQIDSIRLDPNWRGGDYYDAAPGQGPHEGVGLARRIAHLTYRTESELDVRFGRQSQPGSDPLAAEDIGRFAVESYLDHHAQKLARRFDAGTYVTLTDAMTTWDVGRGRGGVASVLEDVSVPVVVGGVDSDRLFPIRLQHELAALLPGETPPHIIASPYGHDGFLIETEGVGELVRLTLEKAVSRVG
jgi:homoserine O-acetyltransferase